MTVRRTTPYPRVEANSYKLLPGHTYDKDPMVTVLKGSEESYIKMTVTFSKASELDAIFAPTGADLTSIFNGYDSANWMDGIKYNVYYADYFEAVDAGATTEQLIKGVYLDKSFDIKDGKPYAFGKEFEVDAGWDWNKVSCPVFAIACQAEGFDNATAAMDAAFGTQYNPWGTTATNWQ